MKKYKSYITNKYYDKSFILYGYKFQFRKNIWLNKNKKIFYKLFRKFVENFSYFY